MEKKKKKTQPLNNIMPQLTEVHRIKPDTNSRKLNQFVSSKWIWYVTQMLKWMLQPLISSVMMFSIFFFFYAWNKFQKNRQEKQ